MSQRASERELFQGCFTSSQTIRLIRDGSLDGHLTFIQLLSSGGERERGREGERERDYNGFTQVKPLTVNMRGNHTAFKSHKGRSEKPSKNLQVKPAFTFAHLTPLDHMQVFSVAMIYRTSLYFLSPSSDGNYIGIYCTQRERNLGSICMTLLTGSVCSR